MSSLTNRSRLPGDNVEHVPCGQPAVDTIDAALRLASAILLMQLTIWTWVLITVWKALT